MKVIKSTVNYVNPNQIPVIALDQPLFALAKQFSGPTAMSTVRITLLSCSEDYISNGFP